MWMVIVVFVIAGILLAMYLVDRNRYVDDPSYEDDIDFRWGMYPTPSGRNYKPPSSDSMGNHNSWWNDTWRANSKIIYKSKKEQK